MKRAAALAIAVALGGAGCRVELGAPGEHARTHGPAGELWIYTSVYRHVADDLEQVMKEKLPGVTPRWFFGGSEKVAQRLDGELEAGATRCDVLLTSDPFYYARLAREGRFMAYVPPRALKLPRSLIDPEGRWVTTRIATMVLVYNTKLLTAEQAPRSFEALADPVFNGKIILGDPLASGTFFTTLAFLEDRYGWDYFRALRKNGLISTGGNTTVIDRISAGELLAGAALLENVLAAKKKGAPVDYVLPAEGPVLVPGPVAIMATSSNPDAARAFADLLLAPEGEAAIVRGDMHVPDPSAPSPAGAPSWAEVFEKAMPWKEGFVEKVEANAKALRSTYEQVVAR